MIPYDKIDFQVDMSYLDQNLPKSNIQDRQSLQIELAIRKPAFCIYENKGADQLRSYLTADQRLCFCYIYSTNPSTSSIGKFKPLAISCCCIAQFVLDLVGNPKDRFSRDAAQLQGSNMKLTKEKNPDHKKSPHTKQTSNSVHKLKIFLAKKSKSLDHCTLNCFVIA